MSWLRFIEKAQLQLAATVKRSKQNICEPGRHSHFFRDISVLIKETKKTFALSKWEKKRKKKKKRNQTGSRRRGEKSGDLESVQLPARDRTVSGSWQPRPDEETGWRHSKPGRESGVDGKEGERHSPNKTVTPGLPVGLPALFPKPWDHGSSGTREYFTRDSLPHERSSEEVAAEAAGPHAQHPCVPNGPSACFD